MTRDPLTWFEAWFPSNTLLQGLEAALATASSEGAPAVRMVLVKAADERGFTFYTSYESRKGRELAANPRAALLFRAPARQVRVEGRVERVPVEESDAYWASRPAASRRSAAASRQSQPVASRAALEAAVARQPEEPPRPSSWGGYRLVPDRFEFWEHREDRLHDRLRYRRDGETWTAERLQP